MRRTPHFLLTDVDAVRRLVAEHPWATFVSATRSGLVASHYPVLVDDEADDLTIVSHFGRPDEQAHELGEHEVLVIVQGPHGYVSPTWYGDGSLVPTWNHVTAHLYGVPEVLSDEENYRMLERLTDRFEAHREGGRPLSDDAAGTRRSARGTVGLRMRVTRFDARAKLSQNRAPEAADRVIAEFERRDPAVAAAMRRVHPR